MVALLCGSTAFGQTIPPAAESAATNVFKHLGGDLYSLGAVRLDKKTRVITFPAAVNMNEGVVEYAVVHATGKVHESVFRTDTDPLHIQLARLLVWPEVDQPKAKKGAPQDLIGPRISISVRWSSEGGERQAPLEDFILNTLTRARMTRGNWVYNGSRVVQGTFLAHRDGSIVAIIADPDATVNNPRPGRDNDEIWKVDHSLTPPVGTLVTITMQLENANEN